MPIIAISRGRFSGGKRLAEELHKRLGWRLLSQEILTETARMFGLTEDEMHRALDLPPNIFERLTKKKQRYVLASQAVLTDMFSDGNGIFHGLGGAFLFEELCDAYKILLLAPLELRIASCMSSQESTREEALHFLREADERKSKWSRQMFGFRWDDPEHYNLVIDLGTTTFEAAADAIVDIMSRDEYRQTPERLALFHSAALATRVRAELLFNSSFDHDVVKVDAEGDDVCLSGGRGFDSRKDDVIDFVRSIPGVGRVITEDDPSGVPGRSTVDDDFGMTTRDTKARDVMLPPSHYPHVRQTVSIREAIVALSASSVRLEDGFFLAPRYVLVLDEDDRVVGIVSRRELLEGLAPHLRESDASRRTIQELVPFGGEVPREIYLSWTSLFSHRAVLSAREEVRSVMRPVRASVRVDDSLSTVISTMLHQGVDLVPVLDGEKIAGVVLMTNIFDVVAQFIMEQGGRDIELDQP